MLWSRRAVLLLVFLAAADLLVYDKIHTAAHNLDAYSASPHPRPTSNLISDVSNLTANSSYDYASCTSGPSTKCAQMKRRLAKSPRTRRLLSEIFAVLESTPDVTSSLLNDSIGPAQCLVPIHFRKAITANDIVYQQGRGDFKPEFPLFNTCTDKNIDVGQGPDSSASGIPQYIVQIINTCLTDCAPSDIHLFCGWFASAPLVNPAVFRRIAYDDCLVNNGEPLNSGEMIRFEYANSFMYPLTFRSAQFC